MMEYIFLKSYWWIVHGKLLRETYVTSSIVQIYLFLNIFLCK
jgi:hypothetical protein